MTPGNVRLLVAVVLFAANLGAALYYFATAPVRPWSFGPGLIWAGGAALAALKIGLRLSRSDPDARAATADAGPFALSRVLRAASVLCLVSGLSLALVY